MKPILEVSYDGERMAAAYLQIPGREKLKAARTEHVIRDLVLVDYARDKKPIGAEVLAPISTWSAHSLLRRMGCADMTDKELAPILAKREKLAPVSIRFTDSIRERGSRIARAKGMQFSDYVRSLVIEDLGRRGVE